MNTTEMPVHSIVELPGGSLWVKTAGDQWRSPVWGSGDEDLSDREMDGMLGLGATVVRVGA